VYTVIVGECSNGHDLLMHILVLGCSRKNHTPSSEENSAIQREREKIRFWWQQMTQCYFQTVHIPKPHVHIYWFQIYLIPCIHTEIHKVGHWNSSREIVCAKYGLLHMTDSTEFCHFLLSQWVELPSTHWWSVNFSHET
jgi:hypothetical protein